MMRRLLLMILIVVSLAGVAWAAAVSLSWNAPTTNEDGSPLTDLAGYDVWYGTASGQYTVTVDAGSATAVILAGLADATLYYFSATARDTSGNQSAYATEISYLTPPAPADDTEAPNVAITQPTDGSVVARGTSLMISATAADNVAVTEVSLFVNNVFLCQELTVPYACAWLIPKPRNKVYRLKATVLDAAGNIGTSPVVSVVAK